MTQQTFLTDKQLQDRDHDSGPYSPCCRELHHTQPGHSPPWAAVQQTQRAMVFVQFSSFRAYASNIPPSDTIVFVSSVSCAITTLPFALTCDLQDIVALVIQALGGASAAAAVNQEKSAKPGGDTMLGGIIFQTGASPLDRPSRTAPLTFDAQWPSPSTCCSPPSSCSATSSTSPSATARM